MHSEERWRVYVAFSMMLSRLHIKCMKRECCYVLGGWSKEEYERPGQEMKGRERVR